MTKREIIIRLALTLAIITTPIVWLLKRYAGFLLHHINRIRNMKLSKIDTIGAPPKDDISHQIHTDQEKNTIEEISLDTNNNLGDHDKAISAEKDPVKEITEEIEEAGSEKKLSEREIKQLESIKFAALSHKERGKIDEYEKKLIEGLAFDTDNIELLQMLGEHYFNTGNHIKALSLLKKVVHVDPENHKVIWQIGQIYLSQNDKDTAKILIEKAITLKEDNPKYHISLVEIYYEQDNLKSAIRSMERILKLRPTNIDYLLTIATLHEEASEPTKAIEYYSKIIELDPMNEMAKKGMKRLSL